MTAAYEMIRNGYLRDEISEQHAGELFEQARAREGSDLVGDLSSGFWFWSRVTDEGVRLVRVRVQPLGV